MHETRPLLSPSPEYFLVPSIDANFNVEWLDVKDMTSRSAPAPPPPRQRPQPPGTQHHPAPGGLGPTGGASAALTAAAEGMTDARAKTVLKEAVDAVVNSFAKHTRSYGRGELVAVLFSDHTECIGVIFLGRARRSWGGLMESCLRRHGGPPPTG